MDNKIQNKHEGHNCKTSMRDTTGHIVIPEIKVHFHNREHSDGEDDYVHTTLTVQSQSLTTVSTYVTGS